MKKLSTEADTILQIGQESEKKAIPLVTEVMQEQDKQETKEADDTLEKLNTARNYSIKSYNMLLAELLTKRMTFVDFPHGWRYTVRPDDIGVVLTMQYKDHVFQSGFKPTGEAFYDLNAVNTYGIRAENTIDRILEEEHGHNHTAGTL